MSDVVNSLMLNTQNGILYFRTSGGNVSSSGMQFTPSPETEALANNTVAVVQSNYKNSIKIEDNSNLHISIDNVYLKTENGLESKTTFLGDGTQWNLFKNPTGETATVTFNTNGGSTIPSEQVVIGQKISAPSTPSKAGYVFDDWYLNGEPFDFNKPIVEDITLVAGWETYEVIDYIESSGTQYIDTGVIATQGNSYKIESKFIFDNNNGFALYGSQPSSTQRGFVCYLNADGKVYMTSGSSTAGDSTCNFDYSINTEYEIEHNIDTSNSLISANVNGTSLNNFTYSGNIDTANSLYILNNNGQSNQIAYTKLFYFRIYDNGTLVRNFIPIKTSDGVYALLDQVNNKAYYNAGTGSFTGGNLQEPVQLSYIESTGTQYIDTGFTHNQNTKLEIKTSFNNIDQIEAIVNSSNNNSPYNNFNLFKINNEYRTDYAESFKSIPEVTFSINTPYIFLQDKNKSYVDGTLVATHPTATFTGSYPIRLLAKTSDGTRQMRGKVYYCKIWDNETLVRDFAPWKDEFGIICLHDNVENKNYYNQGTGTFIAGNGV